VRAQPMQSLDDSSIRQMPMQGLGGSISAYGPDTPDAAPQWDGADRSIGQVSDRLGH
jgi:hypothetical protein